MTGDDDQPEVQIIVCVHDALDDVTACLASICEAEYPRLRLVLLDDGSGPETRDYLTNFSAPFPVTLLRHEEALGYTRAVNAGLRNRADSAATLLLNSDTVLTRSAIGRMVAVLTRWPDVGVVGPLSNAASWESVPLVKEGGKWSVNTLPPGWDIEAIAGLVAAESASIVFPRVPLLNGFCLLIRDTLFERIGLMDEDSFPRGYGEETDFCLRASDAGFGLMVALDAYVFHAKSKSYGSDVRATLSKASNEILRRKYRPARIDRASETMRLNPSLIAIRERVDAAMRGALAPAADSGANPAGRATPMSVATVHNDITRVLAEGNVGIHDVAGGVTVEIIEPRSEWTHRNFRASLPASSGIETGFSSGPVFTIRVRDAIADIDAGVTIVNGRMLRATAVTARLSEHYPDLREEESVGAVLHQRDIILPLASQRMENYCRWWLDSVSKLYLSTRIAPPGADRTQIVPFAPPFRTPYQQQTEALLAANGVQTTTFASRLFRGDIVNSSGLCFGGGQNIAAAVKPFAGFLQSFAGDASEAQAGERIYLSRQGSKMRRVLNEDAFVPRLRDLGFNIIVPDALPLTDQIALFSRARIILAPHGAGLTNILFCRPGLTLIEIFAEGGVHGSAFSRIASHLDFPYYFVVGAAVENTKSGKNPNNADIVLDVEPFLAFVSEIVEAPAPVR